MPKARPKRCRARPIAELDSWNSSVAFRNLIDDLATERVRRAEKVPATDFHSPAFPSGDDEKSESLAARRRLTQHLFGVTQFIH